LLPDRSLFDEVRPAPRRCDSMLQGRRTRDEVPSMWTAWQALIGMARRRGGPASWPVRRNSSLIFRMTAACPPDAFFASGRSGRPCVAMRKYRRMFVMLLMTDLSDTRSSLARWRPSLRPDLTLLRPVRRCSSSVVIIGGVAPEQSEASSPSGRAGLTVDRGLRRSTVARHRRFNRWLLTRPGGLF